MRDGIPQRPWSMLGRGVSGAAAALFINLLLFSAALWLLGPTPGHLIQSSKIMVRVMETDSKSPTSAFSSPRPAQLPLVLADEQVPDFKAGQYKPTEQTARGITDHAVEAGTLPARINKEAKGKTQADSIPSKGEVASEATGDKAETHHEISSSGPGPGPRSTSLARGSLTVGPFSMGQVDRIPEATRRPRPIYPRSARRRGTQGWVKVRFVVDRRGLPSQTQVLESSPPGVFDGTVLEALPRWRFNPGVKNGQVVDTWVVTTIRFQLTD